ncbi:MAG: RNA polymerase sigma factor, partial [Lachnospiraceae bacterium]|nr:RNA polymerase sigma factor [Lachnospiraceae bacterium]
MIKNELLKVMNDELLEKLFGFCYARTNDSYEAQELCSDIIFELVKAAHTDGSIDKLYPFIWRIARNVYADFLERRKRHFAVFYEGNADVAFSLIAEPERDDDSDELLDAVYRRIAFLTKAYREVMILFYIDGLSTAEIAKLQNTSETAIRQRLFSARKKVRSEVDEMNEINNRPIALDKIEYVIWGSGDPSWSDPRNVCTRQLSKHIIWLCHKKPMSASEIAGELNVPTVYVEEELEILTAGENGKYGLLRKLDNGKFAINFILLDRETIAKAQELYLEQLPNICDKICDFIEKNKEAYLA